MKLQKYINESKIIDFSELSAEDIAKMIKMNCKKYINLLNGKTPLYKGLEIQYSLGQRVSFGSKSVRQDRRPMGTPLDLYRYVNKWLKDNKFPTRQESVITSSNRDHANFFGKAYYFFPIGSDWKYAWVKAGDFNDNEYNTTTSWDIDEIVLWFATEEWDELDRLFRLHLYLNKGFKYPHQKGYEIWFNCKYYYFMAIPGDPYTHIDKELTHELKKIGVKL